MLPGRLQVGSCKIDDLAPLLLRVYPMNSTPSPWPFLLDGVRAMPESQIVVAMAFFIIAGNCVFVLHCRRVGKPVLKSMFNPMVLPILQLKRRESLMLAGGVCRVDVLADPGVRFWSARVKWVSRIRRAGVGPTLWWWSCWDVRMTRVGRLLTLTISILL